MRSLRQLSTRLLIFMLVLCAVFAGRTSGHETSDTTFQCAGSSAACASATEADRSRILHVPPSIELTDECLRATALDFLEEQAPDYDTSDLQYRYGTREEARFIKVSEDFATLAVVYTFIIDASGVRMALADTTIFFEVVDRPAEVYEAPEPFPLSSRCRSHSCEMGRLSDEEILVAASQSAASLGLRFVRADSGDVEIRRSSDAVTYIGVPYTDLELQLVGFGEETMISFACGGGVKEAYAGSVRVFPLRKP